MSKKDNIYLIGAASYEDTVEQRLTLYNYIRQLAFLAKHMKTAEDYIHLKRAAAAYGDEAEGLFHSSDIPRRGQAVRLLGYPQPLSGLWRSRRPGRPPGEGAPGLWRG